MIKILLLIDYSSEFDRKLLRGLVQYSKENGPWLFYRLPSYYSAMYGEQGILNGPKNGKRMPSSGNGTMIRLICRKN